MTQRHTHGARGQTVLEYALILAFVAALAIAALVVVGARARHVIYCAGWILGGHNPGADFCDRPQPAPTSTT